MTYAILRTSIYIGEPVEVTPNEEVEGNTGVLVFLVSLDRLFAVHFFRGENIRVLLCWKGPRPAVAFSRSTFESNSAYRRTSEPENGTCRYGTGGCAGDAAAVSYRGSAPLTADCCSVLCCLPVFIIVHHLGCTSIYSNVDVDTSFPLEWQLVPCTYTDVFVRKNKKNTAAIVVGCIA